MAKQTFEPVETISLRQADGDVAIRGWDEAAIELALDGPEDDCTAEQQENELLVECRAPLTLHVPRSTTVNIGQVSGDLLLQGLDRAVSVASVHGSALVSQGDASVSLQTAYGDLGVEDLGGPFSVAEAHGDVHLKRVSSANLGSVQGDVHARDVAANLEMGSIGGDVRLRRVAGQVKLEEGRSDFHGRALSGGLKVHQLHGSLSLRTELTPGLTYSARALGDISARFPPETSARFTLQAQGDLSAPLPEIEEEEAGRVVGQAGAGEAEVVLEAGGALSVKIRGADEEHTWGFSMESLGAEIEAQIAAHMGEFDHGEVVAREIEKAMRQVEREIEKAQQHAERMAERAQERARKAEEYARQAQEKALEKARKLQAKAERRWGAHGRTASRARRSSSVRRGPSGEEQMTILSMLQAGKITVEDAERLLKALEGQG